MYLCIYLANKYYQPVSRRDFWIELSMAWTTGSKNTAEENVAKKLTIQNKLLSWCFPCEKSLHRNRNVKEKFRRFCKGFVRK